MQDLATAALGRDAFPVRAICFDKTREANWKVTWHQDVTIAVRKRIETPGYGPWSIKDGLSHVQPPASVLQRMVTVRLHLDDCGDANGPLRVVPGSHVHGRLSAVDISALRARESEVHCTALRGDVILMRPLILHASSAATAPDHRRVLHIDYAIDGLPCGLEWFEPPIHQSLTRLSSRPIPRCV